MTLKKTHKLAYKWFKKFAEKKVNEKLEHDLESAHSEIRGAVYLSVTILYSILGMIISFVALSILVFIILPSIDIYLNNIMTGFFLFLSVLIGVCIYLISLQIPGFTAKSRGKKIDQNLPYALNFVSAMSAAGVTPTEIFKSLSKQEIYGEIREEASWIYRDVALLGTDILTAIKNNMTRTPSEKFQEFLQGLIVTVTSGGSLKSYFVAKANQFMIENRQNQKQFIETLSIMAESYVTAAVAGVLLLFIVIPIMMIISGDASQLNFLYVLIFLVVPMIHLGFSYVIRAMSMEA
jgi:flagellar protein FlaJ